MTQEMKAGLAQCLPNELERSREHLWCTGTRKQMTGNTQTFRRVDDTRQKGILALYIVPVSTSICHYDQASTLARCLGPRDVLWPKASTRLGEVNRNLARVDITTRCNPGSEGDERHSSIET